MNIDTHDNGWTIIVNDINLKEANDNEAQIIGSLVATNTVVVIQNQNLTASEETAFCAKIGQVESYNERLAEAERTELDEAGKTLYNKVKGILEPDTDNSVIRVTAEHDDQGRPGLFGHASELDWHCNQAANSWRDPIVWLYGVKGTQGSRTSWINTIMAYNDLSDELKREYADIKTINGYSSEGGYSEEVFHKAGHDINTEWTPNMVHTNIAGETGLFFPFLQMHQVVGMNEADSKEFIIKVRDHLLQEKYMYHHDWQDGDVVISEQWLGLHKRWHCDTMDQRVLHRVCFNFDHIKF